MKGISAVALTLLLALAACGATAAPEGGPARHGPAEFHDPLLGISARVPAGWSTRHARRGGTQLRVDLSAASFPLRESSSLRAAVCRSDGRLPPPGGVGVLLYEHPALNGARVGHLKSWFPPRPARFRLGKPGNQEGYHGFNLFFQDRRRALQAQVCLHRGNRFTEPRRRQVERFLDSLRFSRPGSQLIGHGTARLGCHGVFAGSGEPDWRRQASSAGPFGLAGAGRDFLRIPHRERDGLFHTKMPALVEGHRPVELSVPPAERDRVGIEVVPSRHPVERVILTPCEDKPRTIWATGLALRDRAPVTLRVGVGARVRELRLGRVARRRPPVRSIRIGGRRPKLVAGRGSLWALTCDRGCTARARPSSDRIVRIDPAGGRVIASRRLRRASDLAVGADGVYVVGFWSGAVRRLDPRTLRVTAELRLRLPFELVPGDRAFLPNQAIDAGGALWVSTARGVLARVDPGLRRVLAYVRLPFDANGGIAAGGGAIWSAEGLAGVFRVDPSRNRVIARIGASPHHSFSAGDLAFGAGAVFAIGARVGAHRVATGRIELVRIDPRSNRVTALAPLPGGAASTIVYGAGALWVPRLDGSAVYRIDPATAKVSGEARMDAQAGPAVAAGRLWAASAAGMLRGVPIAAIARRRAHAPTAPNSHRRGYRDARFGVCGRLPPGRQAARVPLVPSLGRSREVFAAATFAPVRGARHPCRGEPTASFARMAPGDALITLGEAAPSRAIRAHPGYFPPRTTSYDLGNGLWLDRQHMGEVPARMGVDFRAAGRFFSAEVAIRGAPTPALLHRISAVLTGLRFERLPRQPISVPAGRIHCGCRERGGRS